MDDERRPGHGSAELDGGEKSGTQLRPEDATFGPLERENAESPEQVAVRDTGRTVAEGELSIPERREQSIKDNTRHDSSLGRR